jgi:hypothetical protein
VKCHRNGFSDCWREQCAIWLRASETCGDYVGAQLAQEELIRVFKEMEEKEQAEREKTLTIKCPEVHRVGLSYE